MRDNTNFAAFVFFSLLSIIATTIFSSIIISQNNNIKSKLENKKQTWFLSRIPWLEFFMSLSLSKAT